MCSTSSTNSSHSTTACVTSTRCTRWRQPGTAT
eukprot:gene12810-16069_t